ncbi:MAG: glycoside hydrolase family 30 beta sandwich domain-containing protein [Puia sp.]|nr:glycoside hydrolase family 30 beta sandwich domain-containing protein [Puia sp.]
MRSYKQISIPVLITLVKNIPVRKGRFLTVFCVFHVCALLLLTSPAMTQTGTKGNVWLTDPGQSIFFERQTAPLVFKIDKPGKGDKADGEGKPVAGRTLFGKRTRAVPASGMDTGTIVIRVDAHIRAQTIDGFGFALTGGSAMNLMKMSAGARAGLLRDLFATNGDHIGASYLRVSIGASDLNDHVFSYDDLPVGQTDTVLSKFDMGPDRTDVIPVLKEILAIDPSIRILGSPWSPPAWMKTNRDTRGGSLLSQYYGVYARYFVKYIRAMKQEGIRVDAITVQNEPLHPGNNPSLLMPAAEQEAFIKNYLGPVFQQEGIDTKIIIYDHNADKPEYPISILKDPDAAKYIDGSAFHLYGGTIDALSKVHEAFPDKNLYFTEQWVGAPGDFKKDIADHIEKLIIGATRNWSRNVIEWNLASDPQYRPHTDRGGCDRCLGAVTIDGDKWTRNPAYYIIAHAAKFVRPGSVRIASGVGGAVLSGVSAVSSYGLPVLPNTAFMTPSGQTVLIVLNNTGSAKKIRIDDRKGHAETRLNAGAVATYVW